MGGRRVTGLACVDDDDRAPLPTELEGGGQASGRSSDDRNLAVAFDRAVFVFAHEVEDTVIARDCKRSCGIRKRAEREADVNESSDRRQPKDLEQVVRTRLRSLRQASGLSLDDLAARANLSASTISRVETGKRTISLDLLVPLAAALQIDLDTLLDVRDDDDVVIRPVPNSWAGGTTWMLSRPTGNTIAAKVRLDPSDKPPPQQVHPGHDWFFVIEGRICLLLGEREVMVEAGEAAEFNTMTPHSFAAVDGPAEIVMIFDRDGQRAHVHNEPSEQDPPTR